MTQTGELVSRIPHLTAENWQSLNWMQRWLVMTRAPVLIMTICATATGILLALGNGHFHPDRIIALLVGLTLAHATNNLINDWVDHRQGVDRDNYFRRQYGAHVLEDRYVSEIQFFVTTALTGAIALLCGLYLYLVTDKAVLYLTMAGSFFVLFYTWPLKHYGLGEMAVLLVWGPMIVGGSFYVMSSELTVEVLALSLAAGISPTLVIFGKHMDKRLHDVAKAIHTLPVLAGEYRSRQACLGMIIIQWTTLISLAGFGNYWLVTCLLALPALAQLIKFLLKETPTSKPDNYPENIWPLWYAALSFRYTRDFYVGLLAALGLAVLFG